MNIAQVRKHALSLPEVSEEPHFQYASFRVRGKIFLTVPPDEKHVHLFVGDEQREPALAAWPDFIEKLSWGGKVVGVRVALTGAGAAVVKQLIGQGWAHKAPKALLLAGAGAKRPR